MLMVGVVMRVVEQRIDCLVAFKIDDAQMLASLHHLGPAIARQHRHFVIHKQYLSVNAKPRPFSGGDTRQASSSSGAGTRLTVTCTGLGAYTVPGSIG